MSRIGKLPVGIPKGVTVNIQSNKVTVKGPKGELAKVFNERMRVLVEDNKVKVLRQSDSRKERALHGLTRTLIANMVEGVSNGFQRNLQIVGIGYRAAKQGQGLQIQVGYSHPVNIEPIKGIDFEVDGATKIVVKGADKELVGQVAANIRSIRPPEPYKGKGIKYEDEVIHRKMGKAGKTAGK